VSNLSLSSDVELISVHIPKTAGSTFGRLVLPKIYPAYQILYDYDNLSINTLIQKGLLTKETRVIHGHFPSKKYKEYCSNAKMVIWLRNPILLLISVYYFWFSFTDNFFDETHRYIVTNKLGFDEFLEYQSGNNVSKYFIESLKLTDFYFVGIQEFFMDDLNELKNKLNWPMIKIDTAANRNAYQNYKEKVIDILNNQSMIEKIVSLNSTDINMYTEALRLRTKRKELSNCIEMYQLSLKESQLRYDFYQQYKLSQTNNLSIDDRLNIP